MAKRQVFYSFYYDEDNWRVSQVRNIGNIEGNKPASDNKWEKVKTKGNKAIKKWIKKNLKYRSCTIVLIGENTAKRKWIDYEIKKSWNDEKGLVGIYIHNLKNKDREKAIKGSNSFKHLIISNSKKKLSSILKCYNPPYSSSKKVYKYIKENLEDWVEEAIKARNEY